MLRFAAVASLALTLAGCNALTRLSEVGEAPAMSTIQNPATITGNRPLEMPMPAPVQVSHQPNSLWRPGSRHFFKDQRASEVGDLVTVVIQIDDNARINNSTARSRGAAEDASLNAFLGYEDALDAFFPGSIDNLNLVNANSSSNSTGQGSVNRGEAINLRVAAVVTQVLPNGNLVVAGRQEMRVNFEMRELQVAGIIRPEDITSVNTIEFDQIAEARIAYGGRGTLSDVQQPRYGQQVFDIIWPF
ncbi:MAG: flagellar basal body L-ring protein FlgH [Kiloniellales bacterium]